MPAETASTWPALFSALLAGDPLSAADTAWAMDEIMAGAATPAQLAAFVVLLRAKGETAEEIGGLVQTMLARATPVTVAGRAVDVVGTGADRAHTVNISTMAAIVVAGSGRQVVKHGNRAATSACGAADVLEQLGVAIDLRAEAVAATVAEVGIGFCFAPVFHPALRHAAAPRRELGIATVFNFLGPLANPARPAAQAVGVSDLRMAPVMAGVLADRRASALVFRGEDGLDELTTTAVNDVWTVRDGRVNAVRFDARDLGLARTAVSDLRGGDADYNAAVARAVLGGDTGPVRDAVLLNAAAALAAFDGVTGSVVEALSAALPRAAESVDSGAARTVLDRWITVSQTD